MYMQLDLSCVSTLYCMLFYYCYFKPSLFTCFLWFTRWVENLFICCQSLDLLIYMIYIQMYVLQFTFRASQTLAGMKELVSEMETDLNAIAN